MARYTPLKKGTYVVSSGFGPRDGKTHSGVDFAAADGTPIFAAQAGSVLRIGAVEGLGQWIVLDHPPEEGGGATLYGHMWNAAATGLAAGSWVRAGQLIGFVGNNGDSPGPHLHFEVFPKSYAPGTQIDPAPWLEGALDPLPLVLAEAPPAQPVAVPVPAPLPPAAAPVAVPGGGPADTVFADVSEWQRPIDDSYPYQAVTIRSNDGTYRDKNWAQNYRWCRQAADSGRVACFLVYFVWRPNWQQSLDTFKDMVGQPHPRMAAMIDLESWGGQIQGDQSDEVNQTYQELAQFMGDARRVVGYGNVFDLNALWPHKPDNLRLVVAAYGRNPQYPGKIAHQYTDGKGYGHGLPEGAPPFGNCDMNSADGLNPGQLAIALGLAPQ